MQTALSILLFVISVMTFIFASIVLMKTIKEEKQLKKKLEREEQLLL